MADEEETDDGGTETEPGETEPDTAHSDVKVGRLAEEEPTDDVDAASILNHVAYVAVAFAATGLGFGVLVFLISQFGADATVIPGQVQSQEAFVTLFIDNSLDIALIFPLFLAPVTGLVVNVSVSDDTTAIVSATLGGFVGAVLFVMFAGLTADLQYPMVETAGQTVQGSFLLQEGLVNSVIVGFVTALVAGVTARSASSSSNLERTHPPRGNRPARARTAMPTTMTPTMSAYPWKTASYARPYCTRTPTARLPGAWMSICTALYPE